MTHSDRSGAAQDILWELSASFIDATAESATSVVESAMGRLATVLDADSMGLWIIDGTTMSGTAAYRWAGSDMVDLGDGFLAQPDPAVRDAVAAGGGLAVVSLHLLVGEDLCEKRGWPDRDAVVALVDQHGAESVVLVVASSTRKWDHASLELIQGVVMLLRQFHGRIRAEERLHQRLALDDLTVALAARLQFASPDNVDDEITEALTRIRESMNLESVLLIDVIDENTVEIPIMLATTPLPSELRSLELPDISEIPGATGMTLREYISEPRVCDVAGLVDAMMGPEITEAFELRDPPRTVVLLPASIAQGDALFAASRIGAGDWNPTEIDALSTLASMIAQTRGRVAAQRDADDLLNAQRALVATGKIFLEANASSAASAIHEALERMAAHLGAALAVIATIEADHETISIGDVWTASPETRIRPGDKLNRNALPLVDALISSETRTEILDAPHRKPNGRHGSVDSKWTTVIAPIRGAGLPSSALMFAWAGADRSGLDSARELADATADLIGQLQVRLQVENEMTTRLRVDSVLSDIAESFLGVTLDDAGVAVERAMAQLGAELGLAGLALSRVESDGTVLESAWAAEGRRHPEVGYRIPFERALIKEDFIGHEELQKHDKWATSIARQWGPGVVGSGLPVTIGARLESMLVAVGIRRFADQETDACRSLAVMLGQLRARLLEERVASRRLAAQRLLSACAAELAEVTPDTLRPVLASLMGRVAKFAYIDVLIDWRVDQRNEQFVRSNVWVSKAQSHAKIADARPWNESPLLEEARSTREVAKIVLGPEVRGRSRLAVPRGDGRAEHVLLAMSYAASEWSEETIELLESLSRMVYEVETRTAAQRYAEAAFHGAPIGVVLRDEHLGLITCNRAFVDFVGADSVAELVGTAPDDIYADNFDSVEWHHEADDQITGEAAFRGPGGTRVWGQMRASVVEGEAGGPFWLIHIEDVTERRRAEQLLRFQATHDELTGLANRRRLLEQIHAVADGAGSVAVLLLDLDRFKNINDSLGHDRGDELLVVVADRLRLAVRPGDLVARLGGDEFAVVLPGPVDVGDAEFVAARLLRLIVEPVVLGRQTIYPTASIGIAIADDQFAVDDLLRRADTAMYRAKSDGRGRAAAFDERLRDEVQTRMETEAGLRGALRNHEFLVHYQPEVSLDDGRVLGAEALIRWQHPTRGLLPAAEFIEVAEETGLVVEMGERVLAAACVEAASWPGSDAAPLVRVNLAAAQLQREETVSLVRSALRDSGLAPARLCLEITESAVMSNINRSEEILHRLKEIGVRLSVDDFGTGFSSLAYLKRFPVDDLKIDRTFVNDLGEETSDRAFVQSIVSLAAALGLDAVAEGVETAEQAAVLVELGCHRAQGYYFARPGPAEAFRAYLAADASRPAG